MIAFDKNQSFMENNKASKKQLSARDVTNVSDPDVPKYNAAVLNSEVDLFASTINTELAVVVP